MREQLLVMVEKRIERYVPTIGVPLNTSNEALHFARLVASGKHKIHLLNEMLRFALKHEDMMLLARGTKFYMENLAVFSYILANANTLNLSLDMFKRKFESVFLNSVLDASLQAERNLTFINVSKVVKTLYPKASKDYEYINDFTHPYFGSNFIALSEEESEQFEIYRHLNRPKQIEKLYYILQTALAQQERYYEEIEELMKKYDRIAIAAKE